MGYYYARVRGCSGILCFLSLRKQRYSGKPDSAVACGGGVTPKNYLYARFGGKINLLRNGFLAYFYED
ncbi:hypothetical protein DB895_00400 [Flavobacterium psychrotolerans]|uniref:Uncharacterized protein n=1 Tax=Flavobacterium psychrotolerans TaxID=2169410 RepID=A0A2U1JQW2_9FLAO|nr:hypothetical protein DB895_00400 [Flavobacterium psychrotolerans]